MLNKLRYQDRVRIAASLLLVVGWVAFSALFFAKWSISEVGTSVDLAKILVCFGAQIFGIVWFLSTSAEFVLWFYRGHTTAVLSAINMALFFVVLGFGFMAPSVVLAQFPETLDAVAPRAILIAVTLWQCALVVDAMSALDASDCQGDAA